jgi:inner membrane protein
MGFMPSFKNSVLFKMFFIGVLIAVLLIPVSMTRRLITERQERRDEVTNEVSGKWGEPQIIIGPILTAPFTVYWRDPQDVLRTRTETAQFLPEVLDITAEVYPEIRSRGIFDVVVYRTEISFKGEFNDLDFDELKISRQDIIWDGSYVSVGIPDLRGIKESPAIRWNGADGMFKPGVPDTDIFVSGINMKVPELSKTYTGKNEFEFLLTLNGSRELQFVPLGKETRVNMSSSWESPSFIGSYLPVDHKIKNTGFTANWQISYFGRSYQQFWRSSKIDYNILNDSIMSSAFGVKLLLTIDHYQKTSRSVKYAILFILLTFITFFLFEVLGKLKIHPFQYLLIGLSMCVFFVLLLSLSEHISFAYSYIIAGFATISLITGYSIHILSNKKRSIIIATLLIILYVFLYILLQIEDYALLVGSVALLLVLAAVMFVTRKVDWYSIRLIQNGGDGEGDGNEDVKT